MFTIHSLYIHYIFTIYSLYIHYIFTIFSLYVVSEHVKWLINYDDDDGAEFNEENTPQF